MKRLCIILWMFIIAWGNPADFINVVVNGVDRGDYPVPMEFNIDYLQEGSHHITLIPHLYVDHTPVQVDMELIIKENKKFEFFNLIPQPGDEQYFNPDLLRVKVAK